ncbi:hypothetical protein CA3LBN_003355 [Candidozyma haemuli]|uniref:Triacylglycerol lipase n=1 Tax=Candidozyma haemuli TaxID=45357 RepID=A0ABX8I7K8_9ASCO|nr:hypothetical protein CA3LBN_003355 [[Candida] haemuloni]
MLFLAFALWLTAVSASLRPTPPSQDSFYNVPKNVAEYKNGNIISFRDTPVQVRSSLFPMDVKNSWQFLVRSEDSFGNPNAFVTTVLEPYNSDPSKVWSYQAWEDSNNIDCAPSYALLYKSSPNTIAMQTEIPFIQFGLSKGWFVAIPDYQGPKSAFTVGRQSGQAVLNGIRAVLNSGSITGVKKDAQVALYGYSGGSIAAGWASQLQPLYAPELKERIVGAALGGWVTNVTSVAFAADGTISAGLIPNAVNGIISEYSDYQHILDQELSRARSDHFYAASDGCLVNSLTSYIFHKFFSGRFPYFRAGADFFRIPEIAEIIRNNTAAYTNTDGVPEIPVFVFHGEADEIVPISEADRAYENFCEWGAPSIEYAVAENTGHVIELFLGTGAAFAWLEKRFDGSDTIPGCQRTVRTSNLEYPGADVPYRQILSNFVRGIHGAEVGEDTIDINDSTWLSKVISHGFSRILGAVGPIPLKRDITMDEAVAQRPVEELYKGFQDVRLLFEENGIDPEKVLMGEDPSAAL